MHPHEVRPPRPRVLIAGDGLAAIEGLLALRGVAGELVSIELIAPPRRFTDRAPGLACPFALTGPHPPDVEELACNAGARLRREAITGVHSARRVVLLAGGGEVRYDRLIVAIGALRKPVVPGALTFPGAAEAADVADLIADVVARGNRRIVFAIPSGATWALPVYELAAIAAAELSNRGIDDATLTIVTAESHPFGSQGAAAGTRWDMLDGRRVVLRTGTEPLAVVDGQLQVEPGPPLPADAVVSAPALEGPSLGGLPCDPLGFLTVDAHGRVRGVPRVYAAGDATGRAAGRGSDVAQQAHAAAAAVAADLGLAPDADAPCAEPQALASER